MVSGIPRPHDFAGVPGLVADQAWLRGAFVSAVQGRGGEVIAKRGASSAASAAEAIVQHGRDWLLGSRGKIVSMGVHTSSFPPAYGVPDGLVFSMPVVTVRGGGVTVVSDLSVDAFASGMLAATADELLSERQLALAPA